jgi:Tc toxin complex TcA C-terminal TcB-binding domain/Neuraminidase-like domain/Putative peptidoglycan binding domain/Salmonella virulence plasmid 28.1kDa A protein
MGYSFRELSLRMHGDDVEFLQESLAKLGYVIDPKEKFKKAFGKTTGNAIRKFQSDYGLEITGIFDYKTEYKMKEIIPADGSKGHDGIASSHFENVLMLETNSKKAVMKVPKSLLESEVYFKSLEDNKMDKLKKEEAIYINQKLNQYFQNDLLLGLIGDKISDTLSEQMNSHIAKLDYTKYVNVTLQEAVNEVLTYLEIIDSRLRQEISKIKESISSVASPFTTTSANNNNLTSLLSINTDQKIEVLLDLKIPLKDNRIFRDELNIEKTRRYINLARLKSSTEDKLLDAKIDFYQFPRNVVFDLVHSKLISEKQANVLKNIASIARLTGDNPKFVRLLAGNNSIISVADLISWKEEDWEKFIVKHEIPLPANVNSPRTYAENIKYNIERWYPTQLLLAHAADSTKVSSDNDSHFIDSVNKLLKINDKLIESGDIAVVNWRGVSRTQKAKMKESLHQLISFSNFYKHLGIQDIINNKALSISKKKAAIKSAINQIRTFNINNPEIDLRLLNFFDNDEMQKLDWDGIRASDKSKIRKQLMAYQRVLTLTDQHSEHALLLTKGYDSAISIGRMTLHEFETACGLEPDRSRIVYDNAQQQLLSTAHDFEAIRDVVRGDFQRIGMSNLNPVLVNDLREIDGFEELFGPQNYCACQECMSILSPAAYFVDLMRFVHKKISKEVFLSPPDDAHRKHPLYLRNRRRDLWHMQISCENTHTLIPYLTIVNEVLQTYLERVVPRLGEATTTNGDKEEDIFKILSEDSQDTKISFSLPFNLPLEEIQMYLGHFGLSISDIYAIFLQKASDQETEEKIWGSRLGLSKEQFNVIIKADLANVKFRYGDPKSLSSIPLLDFLKSTGLSREQLDELLQIKFNRDLAEIVIEKRIVDDSDELLNFEEFLNNPNNKRLTRLDFIHRFIQLLRRTKWSISELDMVLIALFNNEKIKKSEISSATVINIGKLVDIQEKLKLDAQELCSLVDRLPLSASYPNPPPNERDKKFFECVFDVKGLFKNPLRRNPKTHSIDPITTFHHYSFNEEDKDDNEVDPKMPILLGGLGITEAELLLLFRLLKEQIPFDSKTGNAKLDLRKISLLYRHVRLARALKFDSIDDFVTAISICFNVRPDPEPHFVIDSVDQIYRMIEFRDWLKSSPFGINELFLIIFGRENGSVQFTTNLQSVIPMVLEIQKNSKTETETEIVTDRRIELLKTSLSTLLGISTKFLERIAFKNLRWIKSDPKSSEIQSSLETRIEDDNPIPADGLDPLINMIHEIERVMLIFSKLKFTEKTIGKIANQKMHLGIADLKKLTLKNLNSLTTYHKLLDSMIVDTEKRDSDKSIGKLLKDYSVRDKFSDESIVVIATLWDKNKEILNSISKLGTLQGIRIPIDAVYLLWKLLDICQTLGINGSLLKQISDDTDFASLSKARKTVLGSFSSKYTDEKTRQEKLEPFHDIMNRRKSDIFCDYILSLKKELKFKDRNDIYSFFLLDPEMGGCARISRIVSAISSLQLYVHRCLVNLEQSDPKLNPELLDVRVDPKLIPKDQWEWRKNFRVWEANRKVFLYPENFLEPDLRDNKSPIFKELEDELLQQKITKDSAEAAYRKYVSQFAELARLVFAGAYGHKIGKINYYYIFGRTRQEPHQLYYRELEIGEGKKEGYVFWKPWKSIDLTINSDRVSAIIHLGKLYIFWVETVTKSQSDVKDGNAVKSWKHERYLLFSNLNEFGKWMPPQKLYIDNPWTDDVEIDLLLVVAYPIIKDNNLYISGLEMIKELPQDQVPGIRQWTYQVNLFKNQLIEPTGSLRDETPPLTYWLIQGTLDLDPRRGQIVLLESPIYSDEQFTEPFMEQLFRTRFKRDEPSLVEFTSDLLKYDPQLHVIGKKYGEIMLILGNQQFQITYKEDSNPNDPQNPIITRTMRRMNTSLHDRLGEILFTQGIEQFLSLETQEEHESPLDVTFIGPPKLSGPVEDNVHLDFQGPYGEYYRELFFHIPFLIAHHLNANQKFKDAKWWYERIFDPTSNESPANLNPQTERNWRYKEFRGRTIEKMKEILTNKTAIKVYKEDPFNPHAIARLRMSAYQKTIVMKYIDNLLDWGDHLFAQDTVESINEASMLYVLASDILGERPVKLGSCNSAMEKPHDLTYQIIQEKEEFESDFLITLENWDHINSIRVTATAATTLHGNGNGELTNGADRDIFKNKPEAGYYDIIANESEPMMNSNTNKLASLSFDRNQDLSDLSGAITNVAEKGTLLFCIPENKDLLKYWDRVEDRLFKIRNCMNISGVRRRLALFQPPINPMLLVRARAAGLTLEDIRESKPKTPLYRFTSLVEKAKQFTQTVQNFGSQLLSALEKKDVEELTLLRSVHERNILQLTKEIKVQQVKEAQYQLQALVETKANVQNRIDHYQRLIDEGLIKAEHVEQISKHTATVLQFGDTILRGLAAKFYLAPQLGSPFSLNYGGKQLGKSTQTFAEFIASGVKTLEMISSSASLIASFQRREEEWNHQFKLAQQELKQVEQQRLAAEIRAAIAEKDLEIHEKNIEQTNELDEFYKNKFTNLGLYNYLSTTMSRLYREAYNLAYDMAKKAEEAYKFELDDETASFIRPDNWQFDRTGLLAGELLILQIQRLEKEFLEKNERQNEITQSFSLALLNPEELTLLKERAEKAECEFIIPEVMFDLVYPGQYKRIIKSVRITMPCVTGPYTNIGAKLTLIESKVRKEPRIDSALIDVPNQKLTSIATSNAQNDGGVFELNFRDERYLPFEGAGAVESKWKLELPFALRSFDYNTISDVILHISYTSKEDIPFREAVQDKIIDDLTNLALNSGLSRLISLKHDFPSAFYKLLNTISQRDRQETEFVVGKNYFPFFLEKMNLRIMSTNIFLKPKGEGAVHTNNLTDLEINGQPVDGWTPHSEIEDFVESAISRLSDKQPNTTWTINAKKDGFNKEKLDDILILINYKAEESN